MEQPVSTPPEDVVNKVLGNPKVFLVMLVMTRPDEGELRAIATQAHVALTMVARSMNETVDMKERKEAFLAASLVVNDFSFLRPFLRFEVAPEMKEAMNKATEPRQLSRLLMTASESFLQLVMLMYTTAAHSLSDKNEIRGLKEQLMRWNDDISTNIRAMMKPEDRPVMNMFDIEGRFERNLPSKQLAKEVLAAAIAKRTAEELKEV